MLRPPLAEQLRVSKPSTSQTVSVWKGCHLGLSAGSAESSRLRTCTRGRILADCMRTIEERGQGKRKNE